MPKIKVESVNVHQIFEEAFTALTMKIASVELVKEEEGVFQRKPHLFVIKTRGQFQGHICAEIEEGLMEEIVSKLNKGKKLPEAEAILFSMEYLNIVCGRALSEINNQIGARSRLTVPYHITGKSPQEMAGNGSEAEVLSYQSPYGRLKVTVTYDYESK